MTIYTETRTDPTRNDVVRRSYVHTDKHYSGFVVTVDIEWVNRIRLNGDPGSGRTPSTPARVADVSWADLVSVHGGVIDTPSIRQQWECHVAGSLLVTGSDRLCLTGGKEHLAGYLGTVFGRTLRATGEKWL